MEILKIKNDDVCSMCARSNCNAHGYEGGVSLCSGYCCDLYEEGFVKDKFVKNCSEIIKQRIKDINKNIKDNSKEYSQLHLDMLKLIHKEIIKSNKDYEYYVNRIKEELEGYKGYYEEYDTDLYTKEEKKELKLKEIKKELRGIEDKRKSLLREFKQLIK